MNINNDYQKRRGQITSFPTGEIIEPNRKYLESNSFYPLTQFLNFREHLKKYRKLNKRNELVDELNSREDNDEEKQQERKEEGDGP